MPDTADATQFTATDSGPIELKDPRSAYDRPPFSEQKPIEMPGSESDMTPRPDFGQQTYTGRGRLTGLKTLVTGGDSGIGRAVALAFAREGADVAIAYLSESDDAAKSLEAIEAAGVRGHAKATDLQEEQNCIDLIREVHDAFGGLDVLVNNAAYQETRDAITEVETELFDRIMKTNVYAPFWLTREAMKVMKPGASVINTVSIQAFTPSASLLPYATTKSALTGMTKAAAGLAMKQGIRVNAVAPGPVWTPFIPGSMEKDTIESFGGSTEFGRPAQPIEMAAAYVMLASPYEASYMTGEVVSATGGKSPL